MNTQEIKDLERQILNLKQKLAELRKSVPPTTVRDYPLDGLDGPVMLSDLFQGKPDLVLICNMGRGCSYCTLWADGFNGVVPELESRAGFALISADPVDVLREFSSGRNWRFQVASDPNGQFRTDMGFSGENGDPWPGVIGFKKNPDGSIQKIASAELGEGDDFCPTWHMFDLLAEGWNGWTPDYRMATSESASNK